MLWLWLLSILSTFSTFLIYPVFFALFSFLILLIILKNGFISKKFATYYYLIITLIFLSSVIFIIKFEYSVTKQYIKLICNLFFLMSSSYFLSQYQNKIIEQLYAITILLEIIIAVSFLQVILNVWLMNLWLYPFSEKLSSSSAANIIAVPPIYFGSSSKNIWATKITYISIVYLSIHYSTQIVIISKTRLYLFSVLIVFSILYTFSRTAQAMLIVFVIALCFYHYNKNKKDFERYMYMIVVLIIIVPFLFYVLIKLLRIDSDFLNIKYGDQGDGLKSRLIMWDHLFNNFFDFSMFGNGILYTEYYFSNVYIRPENNFHNIFLNIFIDLGILGILLYLALLFRVFFNNFSEYKRQFVFWVLLPPFLVCANSQYLGYDNDLIVYFSFVYLIGLLQYEPNNHQDHIR